MSNSNMEGAFGLLVIAGTIFSWVGSGTVAWNWVEPSSFGGAVGFLIVWAILGYALDLVIGVVLIGLATMFKS